MCSALMGAYATLVSIFRIPFSIGNLLKRKTQRGLRDPPGDQDGLVQVQIDGYGSIWMTDSVHETVLRKVKPVADAWQDQESISSYGYPDYEYRESQPPLLTNN